MKKITIKKISNYLHHGIINESGGYGGTADNRLSIKMGILKEYNKLSEGAEFQIEVNNKLMKDGAVFKKVYGDERDLELLNY